MEEYTEDWKLDCNGEERRPLPTPVLLDRYQNTRTCKLGSSQLVEKKEVQKVWQNGSNSQMIENREREKCVRSGYGFGVSEAILCYHKITSLPRKI